MSIALTDIELHPYTQSPDLGARAHGLLRQQKSTWEAVQSGYGMLEGIQTRTLDFGDFSFRLQFNPRRIVSSAAKVDAKSIAERKCFLCPANLPPQQRGLPFADRYLVLVNPFPIFPEHFTIPDTTHTPQRIQPAFGDMLDLAAAMTDRYTLFYNGPKCGASAPDHFHFQAGNTGFMPIDIEYNHIKSKLGTRLTHTQSLSTYIVDHRYLRPFISFESTDRAAILDAFNIFYTNVTTLSPSTEDEPMLNVLTSHQNGTWRTILFPRAKHRPACFFAEPPDRILLSPASVDFGGVCVTPIEQDFLRVDQTVLTQMFHEVCIAPDTLSALSDRLGASL